jgi:hypothetical protein
VFIETIDNECFTASTYIDPSDSLFGACQVFLIVGAKAIRSMRVAKITDQSTFLVRSHGKIEIRERNKHTLSKFVISLVL